MFEGPHNSYESQQKKAEELSNQIIDRFNEDDQSTWITEAEANTLEAAGDPMGVLANEKTEGRYPRPQSAEEMGYREAA